MEGLKPLGQGHIVPETFDEEIVDRMVRIEVDDGYRMSAMLASKGIFGGQSSGAYMQGAWLTAKDAPNRPRRHDHQRHRRALLQHEPLGLGLQRGRPGIGNYDRELKETQLFAPLDREAQSD